ncbi:hypothetical protein [Acinetobacter sp. YH01025]|uniref:hypothetical protein n=1 Tax=Acinetobacter sp. YH01025 TaxID=2601038 RepID=UPI0015D222C4|nr:hypothetical protein [Acinetobacter sp. YH01025]
MKFYERVISDFGGYEKCKDILSQPNIDFIMNVHGLREHMLKYRRQHNIFEVGDYVLRKDGFANVLKITAIDEGHADLIRKVDGEPRWSRFKLADIRHATDDEIKAGKRLEVMK